MAVYLKNNPKGIDNVINELNSLVYNSLVSNDWNDYNAYHRAYKNPTSTGIVAEVFDKDDKDYKEVFFDDTLGASSFFTIEDNIPSIDLGTIFDTTVSLIFQVNLDTVAGSVDHRADEEVVFQVVNALKGSKYGHISSIDRGVENVYSGFKTDQIQYTDMNPFFCFKVNVDVTFQYECCDGCSYVPLETGYLLAELGGYLIYEDGGKIEINTNNITLY